MERRKRLRGLKREERGVGSWEVEELRGLGVEKFRG